MAGLPTHRNRWSSAWTGRTGEAAPRAHRLPFLLSLWPRPVPDLLGRRGARGRVAQERPGGGPGPGRGSGHAGRVPGWAPPSLSPATSCHPRRGVCCPGFAGPPRARPHAAQQPPGKLGAMWPRVRECGAEARAPPAVVKGGHRGWASGTCHAPPHAPARLPACCLPFTAPADPGWSRAGALQGLPAEQPWTPRFSVRPGPSRTRAEPRGPPPCPAVCHGPLAVCWPLLSSTTHHSRCP